MRNNSEKVKSKKMRVLILGATGMLGSSLFREISKSDQFEVFGTIRNNDSLRFFSPDLRNNLISNIYIDNETSTLEALRHSKPDIVVNCVGIVKQSKQACQAIDSLTVNAILPHRLAKYTEMMGARLVHFSTDCVFSGEKGQYLEQDVPDAIDLYGRTKLLGEVTYENVVTLRTSIIGHELNSSKSLVDWFLSQDLHVKGYRKAFFSGLPTIEIARVLRDYVFPIKNLQGLYHLSVNPINKYDLLCQIAQTYQKNIMIIPDDTFVIDRSLNSDLFRSKTGFEPKPWIELIEDMHTEYVNSHCSEL